MNLNRLWEILSGTPHLRLNAETVKAATSALAKKADEFEVAVKPYTEAQDPLVMFMTDVFNQRRMRGGNAKLKHHP